MRTRYSFFLCLGMLALLMLTGCSAVMPVPQDQWTSRVTNCFPCLIYRGAFDAIGLMMNTILFMTIKAALILLVLGWLAWIFFYTIKMFIAGKQPNIGQYWQDVLTTLFKVILVSAVLLTSDGLITLISDTLMQVLKAALGLASAVLSSDPTVISHYRTAGDYAALGGEPVGNYILFTRELGMLVQDIVYRIYVVLQGGIRIGFYVGTTGAVSNGISFTAFFLGLFIMFAFFALSLVFPLSMVESFIKFGLGIVMLPFMLVAWIFKPTRGWLNKTWQFMFGTIIQIIITCFFVTFVIVIMTTFAEQVFPGFFSPTAASTNVQIVQQVNELTVGTLSFFAVTVFLLKMLGRINKYTNEFGGPGAQSEFLQAAIGTFKTAVNLTKAAVGALIMWASGGTLGKEMAASGMKQAAKSAQNTANESAEGNKTKKDEQKGTKDAG